MSFRFEFEQKPRVWNGRMMEGRINLFGYSHPATGFEVTNARPTSDKHGISEAVRQRFKEINRMSMDDVKARDFRHFQRLFIAMAQNFCLWSVRYRGYLPVPENNCDEFWTEGFLIKVARKFDGVSVGKLQLCALRDFLLFNWELDELHKLDRYELAKVVNGKRKLFPREWKPGTVWQVAYRDLGLVSERTSGAKPKV